MRTGSVLLLLCLLSACGKGPAGERGQVGAKGDAGAPGADAALSAYSIVNVIDVCGDAPGIIDEVLLVLANGQVLVSFSENANGKNTRFSILPPGTYQTTDGSACVFTLTADGQVL